MTLAKYLPLCATAAMLFVPMQTKADDAMMTSDLRCLVVLSATSAHTPNPALKATIELSALYFLGRVDGRDPELDLTTSVQETADEMRPQDFVDTAKQCGSIMAARMVALGAITPRIKPK